MNSAQKNKAPQNEKPITVFVRVRPLNQSEINSKSYSVVNVNNGREISVKEKPIEKLARHFLFDKAFGPDSKQVDVYKKVVYPLIEEVLAGYNCTVFAYGQTGTGKTFTMEGGKSSDANVSWEDDPLSGIIPRSLSHLFDELRIKQLEHTVRVSFLELYNEELFDLLSPPEDASKLRLFEDSNKKGSVIIQGLEEIAVHNKAEVYKIMEKGSQKRQTAATLMNAHSSRSHTVFSITVHIKETSEKGEELVKIGKLNLVDLAGSENIGRSGAIDKRAREAGNINQSLLTLGRVITSLVEHAPHIPYRESKLTRLLQDSLGGRTKTSIIATVSPALCNLEETISTLEYACRAKNITNRPEVNQKLTKKAFLKEYAEEIERLKRDLMATRDRNGVYVATENYTQMTLQLEEQEREISEKMAAIKALKEEMEKREELYEELSTSLTQAKLEAEKKKQKCKETQKKLIETVTERDENKHLKEKHMETEIKLKKQAEQLLSVATVATSDTIKLHEKIERKGCVESNLVNKCQQFCTSLKSFLSEARVGIETQSRSEREFFNILRGSISNVSKSQSDSLEVIKYQLQSVCDLLSKRMESFTDICQEKRKEKHDQLLEVLNELKSKLDEKHSVSAENISEKIIPKLEEVFVHLQDLDEYMLEYNDSVTHLKNRISSLKDENNSLKNFTMQHMKEQLKSLKTLQEEEDKSENFESVSSQLEESKNKIITSLVDQLNKATSDYTSEVNDYAQRMTECSSKYNETINAALANFLQDQSICDSKLKQLTCSRIATNKNVKKQTEEIFDSMDKELGNCEPNFEKLATSIDGLSDLVSTQHNDLINKVQPWVALEQDKLSYIRTHAECISSTIDESRETHNKLNERILSDVNMSNKELSELELERSKEIMDRLTESVTTLNSLIDEVSNGYESASDDILNNIEDRLNNSLKSETERIESLQIQDNLTDQFLSKDITVDVPTGSTPQKRDFEYSHDLVATSPHEVILQRFRENYQTPPQLLLDDSIDYLAEEDTSEGKEPSDNESALSVSASASMKSLDLSPKSMNDSKLFVHPSAMKKLNQSKESRKKILVESNKIC